MFASVKKNYNTAYIEECQRRAVIASSVWIFRNFVLHLAIFIAYRTLRTLYARISRAVRALERRCAFYLRILKIYLTKWTHFNFRPHRPLWSARLKIFGLAQRRDMSCRNRSCRYSCEKKKKKKRERNKVAQKGRRETGGERKHREPESGSHPWLR